MASAIDDEDLALSINPSYSRRSSVRGPSESNDARRGSAGTDPPDFKAGSAGGSHHRPSSSTTSKTTHRLGQYEIIRTLGEGSFGKVKLAVHVISGQKVALKIINRNKLMARDMQGRIEREIQYLQLLRHPHIIKLYTVITTPREIIMVLEYAGSELFNYIVDHGRMVEDKARMFFQQIVCAVEYCHRHKIVHRDLKPENLLLDENLHVKIADFGLSNIMTDGNFLKTSCGSPNYAAPEVISGKLYAGPEVDVWSCGVILYVLLVGKLPFDDEYIPQLFKKIAAGTYHVPHYLSPGAVRLIKRMLQISPVQRITVAEIRQDEWFNKNLPEYLQPPEEEFLDTGVDPNKAINPRKLAPKKPIADVERLHEQVIGKLGKTMGYGKDDVNEALSVDEPNAIKDAYLIVAENQMMKETPSLAQDPTLQPFLATSPPVANTASPLSTGNTSYKRTGERPPLPSVTSSHSKTTAAATISTSADSRSPATTIGVLPSSLPDYHDAFMKGQPKPLAGSSLNNRDDSSPPERSKEQHAAAAQRLKPHSRSTNDKSAKPDGMTPIPTHKKSKGVKWQFGIRSRNQPAEAMLAIYKALKAMGAEWEVPKYKRPGAESDQGSTHETGAESEHEISGSASGDDLSDSARLRPGEEVTTYREESNSGANSKRNSQHASGAGSASGSGHSLSHVRARSRYTSFNNWGYLVPHDPWVINARFRKDGMYPPGVAHPNSTHSSRVDLQQDAQSGSSANTSGSASARGSDTALASRRRSSTISSTGSTAGSSSNLAGANNVGDPHTGPGAVLSPSSSRSDLPAPDDSAYVYLTIQLYSIEKEFYLVDFKCAGYERLVRKLVRALESQNHSDASSGKGSSDAINEGVSQLDLYEHGERAERRRERKDSQPEFRMREETVGVGRMAEEKDVSSPFPFLDVASRLIIQLAEAE